MQLHWEFKSRMQTSSRCQKLLYPLTAPLVKLHIPIPRVYLRSANWADQSPKGQSTQQELPGDSSHGMLALNSLPFLACWHLQFKQGSRGTAGLVSTPFLQTHTLRCYHTSLANHFHFHVSGRYIATTAAAEASDQSCNASPFDRLLAVSMYCLPLYEGVWRYGNCERHDIYQSWAHLTTQGCTGCLWCV